MTNVGEELVADYLKFVIGCEFVSTNVSPPEVQGEIDVVGMHLKEKRLFVCEVATHLTTGLRYTTNKTPDNVDRFIKKFSKDIEYARKYFPEYEHTFMLWSPIVRDSKATAKHNQIGDIAKIRKQIMKQYHVELETVINEVYLQCLEELKEIAAKETEALASNVMRLFQIESKLRKHVARLGKQKNSRQ
jgi:hypothetical protein